MDRYAYVGCRTTKERKARGKGISVYKVTEGEWNLIQILKEQENPSYLCLNEAQDRLYSIHGDFSQVSAYKVEEDGTLKYLNTVKTYGTNPVHLTLDPEEKWLYVANLQTGSVSVIPVLADGSLGKIQDMEFISGDGGPGHISHPHQTMKDRSGKWLLIPSQGRLQGIGKITVFAIEEEKGGLKETFIQKGRTGSEPRHCVFHPSNRFCYCVNEKDSTVAAYDFDETTGSLALKQILTSLPQDYAGDGWASAIDIHPAGHTLYVSNRKHDSITVYHLGEDGQMTYVQNIKTSGQQPRFITLDPEGTRLFAANELSDTIHIFDIQEDGLLKETGKEIHTESPVCLVWKTR